MSNTHTDIAATEVAQEVLEAYKAGLTPLSDFSQKHDVRTGASAIYVPVITARTALTAQSTYETGDTTIEGVAVTPSTLAQCSWHTTDTEAMTIDTNDYIAKARECGYAVAKSVYQGVIGLFVLGTFGDVEGTSKLTVTAANFDVDDLATLKQYLLKRDALGQATAVMDIDYAAGLWRDAAVQDASALGSDEMIRAGVFRRNILGVNVVWTNAFPTALTNENTGVVLAVPSSVALATRPVPPSRPDDAAAAGLDWAIATDPDTGLSILWRQWYNTEKGVSWGCAAVQYGASVTQATGAVRAVSA